MRPDPDNISLSDLSTSYLLLQYLGRSLSTGHDSDRGYNSYTTGQSCESSYSVGIVLVMCLYSVGIWYSVGIVSK